MILSNKSRNSLEGLLFFLNIFFFFIIIIVSAGIFYLYKKYIKYKSNKDIIGGLCFV